jgi:hypothetical protein
MPTTPITSIDSFFNKLQYYHLPGGALENMLVPFLPLFGCKDINIDASVLSQQWLNRDQHRYFNTEKG